MMQQTKFRTLSCLVLTGCLSLSLFSQVSGVPLFRDDYRILDRMDVRWGGFSSLHTAIRPFDVEDVFPYVLSRDSLNPNKTPVESFQVQYLKDEHHEGYRFSPGGGKPALSRKPLLKALYKTPANFWELNEKHVYLRLNPLLNLEIARQSGPGRTLFQNQRGLELKGGIDDKVFFYTNLVETQARFSDPVSRRIERDRSIPGSGFYKKYNSEIFNSQDAYDFLNAQAYVGFRLSRHIRMQFGHGKHFIGEGYRSVLLSDFSANRFYLQLNTQVGRFHYMNLFSELSAVRPKFDTGDDPYPKKYMAAHYLSFRASKNLTFGLFESIIFRRKNNGFELQYLNPVILYRSIEHQLSSPDNALIGFTGKWNFLQHFQFYGQFLLDEFKFDELFIKKRGWWANKFAVQGGLKYYDVFDIPSLDLQLEYNTARPYTYTHFGEDGASYAHFYQPLAHPLGANFKEALAIVRYQPAGRWLFEGKLFAQRYGRDSDSTNVGSVIYLDNSSRDQEYGNHIGQGVPVKVLLGSLDVSYQWRHNLFLDLFLQVRREKNGGDTYNNSIIGGAVRLNLGRYRVEI